MRKKLLVLLFAGLTLQAFAQQPRKKVPGTDSAFNKMLDSITINTLLRNSDAVFLPDSKGTVIYAGKRTNLLQLSNNTAGVQLNNGRTVLARIPGLTLWEMDGAGTQMNIGTRGTDAHRSIEMNMRQNGYNTNSDIFGYPENHYTVPMQAIEEIQLVRGSAALQFGPQFGGMLNYTLKQGDSTKPVAVETEQTVGSNNLFNSYNAVGGTVGKWNYYTFYDYRHGDGWRNNAQFDYHSYYAHIGYQVNAKMNIAAEFSRMEYVQQIAGGLTDAQFKANPTQSERARNYFQPVINIPALLFKYNINANTKLETTVHSVTGQRNSVQFINAGNIADTVNTALGTYNPRQVDRDYYKGITAEARLLHQYTMGKNAQAFSAGIRYFTELTKRRQKGVGTTAGDFDLSLTKPYGIDLHLTTTNYAMFAENIFRLSSKLSVTPGVRYEIIKTNLDGVINNASTAVAYRSTRNFPLFGTGIQYQLSAATQLYGNISQAYRPYLYANITPADRLDKIDPALKDSKGYDIDLGWRGRAKNILQFEVNAFYLYYGNKIGLVSQTPAGGGNPYLFTTNIGNAVIKGVEAFGELSLMKWFAPDVTQVDVKVFNSLAYNDAHYKSGMINQAGVNKSIAGNDVENAPAWVNKCGVKLLLKNFNIELQHTYTSKTYNDAFNTEFSSNGVIGVVPAWHVMDVTANFNLNKRYHIAAGINNLTNEKYFNRRITMYPGPGILPADGRTFNISFGVKL
ncbi:MAG: TonB-dependent receptor [Bacteroidetes bacterium]|nr:TonB-dependent receptor [Bacteroidota bacterium]